MNTNKSIERVYNVIMEDLKEARGMSRSTMFNLFTMIAKQGSKYYGGTLFINHDTSLEEFEAQVRRELGAELKEVSKGEYDSLNGFMTMDLGE